MDTTVPIHVVVTVLKTFRVTNRREIVTMVVNLDIEKATATKVNIFHIIVKFNALLKNKFD